MVCVAKVESVAIMALQAPVPPSSTILLLVSLICTFGEQLQSTAVRTVAIKMLFLINLYSLIVCIDDYLNGLPETCAS